MSAKKTQIKLGAFLLHTGHHVAAWRHPDSRADGGLSIAEYQRLAAAAERGKFDALFLADGVAVRAEENPASLGRVGHSIHFEPLTLLSALAVQTSHVGLIATVSTSFNEPYHVARQFASLDHLSGGRAGWNVVTSGTEAEAKNFNLDRHYEHAARYRRAQEFVEVTQGLWDSWEDDAFIRDKESGRYFDAEKLHVPGHKGDHFSVKGPLNIARPPQGWPVIVQAGASEAGLDLAARTAEVIFVAHTSLANAQAYYAALKGRLARYGRTPDQVKIMPGVFPVIGRTEEEAREKFQQIQDYIHPSVGLSLLSGLAGGVDLSKYDIDGPLPYDQIPETNGGKSRQQLIFDLARRENLTIRQLYQSIAGARGHWQIVGTPEQIADHLEEWFTKDAADGFNVMPPVLPNGLDEFVDLVVPELQRRGLFRTDYEGRTLRENLGLARPANRHALRREAAATA